MAKTGNSRVVTYKLVGVDAIINRMAELKKGVRNKAMRAAMRQSAQLVKKSVKNLAPVDTTTSGLMVKGLYRKSIGVKVITIGRKIGKTSGGKFITLEPGDVAAIVGARRGFKQQVNTQKRAGKKGPEGTPVYQDPANIGHLLEFGHGGPHPTKYAHPHLRPAIIENESAILGIFTTEVEKVLQASQK